MKALRDARWPNPILASASGDTSSVLGPTGVKMTGPYDWVPPGYWYDPRADGGAEGFNTETSAGTVDPGARRRPSHAFARRAQSALDRAADARNTTRVSATACSRRSTSSTAR